MFHTIEGDAIPDTESPVQTLTDQMRLQCRSGIGNRDIPCIPPYTAKLAKKYGEGSLLKPSWKFWPKIHWIDPLTPFQKNFIPGALDPYSTSHKASSTDSHALRYTFELIFRFWNIHSWSVNRWIDEGEPNYFLIN